jgi:predicted permease
MWMDRLVQDVRYAVRQIRRQPGFAVVATLSLALGVGANAAVFNAARMLVLRPVPGVAEPERVVELAPDEGGFSSLAYPDFVDLRGRIPALEAMAAYAMGEFSFSAVEGAERIIGLHVTPEYFTVMGVEPHRGRLLLPEDDRDGGATQVAVLSHRFWETRLGASPAVVGSTVRVNRVPFQVIGIAPPDFRGHTVVFQPDVYLPFHTAPLLGTTDAEVFDSRRSSWHQAVALLAPGASVQQADAQVKSAYAALAQVHPETNAGRGGIVVALGLVPGDARAAVGAFVAVLEGMVLLVLLVTCANVAGMFVSRHTAREREMAVRLSLGAARPRLVRQLVTEAMIVFLLGGALGTLTGLWLLSLAPVDLIPVPFPIRLDLSPDPGALAAALALTLGTGVAFGLLPALGATRLDLTSALRNGATRRAGLGWLRRSFVAGQVAFSLVLLVSAGLLLRALDRAAEIRTGFDPSLVLRTGVNLELEGYTETEGLAFQERLVERLRRIPGVTSAALADDLPLDLSRQGTLIVPEGSSGADARSRVLGDYNQVSPEYFETLRIAVLEGRPFESADAAGGEPVAIVSRTFAARVWPGESAVGRRVSVLTSIAGGVGEPRTIVGVVEDVKSQLVSEELRPAVYLPLSQAYSAETNAIVRAEEGDVRLGALVREALLELDPAMSIQPVVSLESFTSVGLLPQRLAAGLASVLGLLAVLLAGIGIYGVVAFAVTQRTREIGVRVALGASRSSIRRLVLRGGLKLVLPGIALGLLAAVGTGYVLRFLLLGVSPVDPLALGSMGVIVLAVVVLACLLPGRRAAGIEPVRALKAE